MKIERRKILSQKHKKEIMTLWNKEYPKEICFSSIAELDSYLEAKKDSSHIIILDDNTKILGWYFDFKRDKERWFALIIDSEFKGKGWGSQLLNLGKANNGSLHGWVVDHNGFFKVNGEPYISPLEFYLKHDFKIAPDQKFEQSGLSGVKVLWRKNQML